MPADAPDAVQAAKERYADACAALHSEVKNAHPNSPIWSLTTALTTCSMAEGAMRAQKKDDPAAFEAALLSAMTSPDRVDSAKYEELDAAIMLGRLRRVLRAIGYEIRKRP